jgi:hypothetical protein
MVGIERSKQLSNFSRNVAPFTWPCAPMATICVRGVRTHHQKDAPAKFFQDLK